MRASSDLQPTPDYCPLSRTMFPHCAAFRMNEPVAGWWPVAPPALPERADRGLRAGRETDGDTAMRTTTRTLLPFALGTVLLAGLAMLTLAHAQQDSPGHADGSRLTRQDIARMLPATDMGAGEGLPAGHPAIGQS